MNPVNTPQNNQPNPFQHLEPPPPLPVKSSFLKSLLNPKLIIIFVIIAAIILAIQLFRTSFSPIGKNQSVLAQPVSDGVIVLTSDQSSYALGEEFRVDIKLSTAGHMTDGTDVVLRFDPNIVELAKADNLEKGSIYPDYPEMITDLENGEIRLSGIATSSGTGFNGTDNFASIYFVAKTSGKTEIKVDFEKDKTTDSNIIESKTINDILGSVYDLKLNIGIEGEEIGGRPVKSCSGYVQVCFDEAGKQGTQECDGGKLEKSVCSFDPYYTISCTECQVD